MISIADPVGQLLSFSGLTFYGGLICGAIAVIYYAKKYGSTTKSLVMLPLGLMLAYGIGVWVVTFLAMAIGELPI